MFAEAVKEKELSVCGEMCIMIIKADIDLMKGRE